MCASVYGWRSELYPVDWTPPEETVSFYSDKFLQDFSYAGYASGEAPLPSGSSSIFDVVVDYGADPTGVKDSTSHIQNAIDDAGSYPEGGIVYLPAGTYKVSLPDGQSEVLRLSRDNVLLRGAGSEQTRIVNYTTTMHGAAIIRVATAGPSAQAYDSEKVAIVKDVTGPSHRLYIEDTVPFLAGDLVEIRWDFTYEWIVEHGQSKWWGVPGDPDPSNPETGPSPAYYKRIVTSVNAEAGWIELNVPARYSILTRDNPVVYKILKRITGCGIEDLSIGNKEIAPHRSGGQEGWGQGDYVKNGSLAWQAHRSQVIQIQYAYNCWVKNVRSFRYEKNTTPTHILSNGIRLHKSFNITVQNCIMQNPQYGGAGGNGYMITLAESNECLVIDCETINSRHGLVLLGSGTSGNVFHNHTDRNTGRAVGNAKNENNLYKTDGEGSDTHYFLSHSNLWDACHLDNSRFESFHRKNFGGPRNPGLTSAHGVYWNTSGEGREYPKIILSDQARYGYIIGTSGANYRVSTDVNFESNNEPEDFSEGIGKGENLVPQSLWLDQRKRRLGE